jgi:glycerophosphoryl diester phosphodiesterase
METVRAVLKATGTERQAIYKGEQPYHRLRERYGTFLDSILYMPMILSERPDLDAYIDDFLHHYRPVAFEISYKSAGSSVFAQIGKLKAAGCRVWTNSLWPSNNAGHDDERAVHDPDAAWGWMIAQGTNIIQTDRPRELIAYLKAKNRRREAATGDRLPEILFGWRLTGRERSSLPARGKREIRSQLFAIDNAD